MAWYMHKCTGVGLSYTLVGGQVVHVGGLPDYYSAIQVVQETEDIEAYTITSHFAIDEGDYLVKEAYPTSKNLPHHE